METRKKRGKWKEDMNEEVEKKGKQENRQKWKKWETEKGEKIIRKIIIKEKKGDEKIITRKGKENESKKPEETKRNCVR